MDPALYRSLRELFVEAHDVTILALNALGPVDNDTDSIDGAIVAESSNRLRRLAAEIVAIRDGAR